MEAGFGEGARVPGSAADATRQQQLMESFCGITSASPDEALFFLESHNWQLDAAIHSFYDASSDHDDPAVASIAPPQTQRREAPDDEDEVGIDDDDDEDYVPPALVRREASPPVVRGRDAKKKKRSVEGSGATRGRGIRTLADLNKEADGSGSDEDEDDGGVEYYTGGEKSGMLVRDPSKRKNDVDATFEQARQMGVQQEPLETAHSSGSRSFIGTGRLLSGETVPVAPRPQQPENTTHDITFWTNGFSVDDGPLRQFDDPSNASFLESIKRSECPKELEPADRRSTVHVNLMRKEEKYLEPVQRQTPFQGVAHTLGTGAAADLESQPPVSSPIILSNSHLSTGVSVDDTLPSTSIQLRLAGGSRIVGCFNMHHTVGDIRSFIDSSHPGGTRNYMLQTVGFPPKQLTDLSQTIEQAGLANSVVIQRLQ